MRNSYLCPCKAARWRRSASDDLQLRRASSNGRVSGRRSVSVMLIWVLTAADSSMAAACLRRLVITLPRDTAFKKWFARCKLKKRKTSLIFFKLLFFCWRFCFVLYLLELSAADQHFALLSLICRRLRPGGSEEALRMELGRSDRHQQLDSQRRRWTVNPSRQVAELFITAKSNLLFPLIFLSVCNHPLPSPRI